jgi:hypothetical protein
MNEKKVMVSPLLVDIYRNFNVLPQPERMESLTRRELYLLLILCWDKFDTEDPIVKENLFSYRDASIMIHDMFDDKPVTDPVLRQIIDETGEQYVDIDVLVDVTGAPLPEPLTKEEVRDLKINLISNEK